MKDLMSTAPARRPLPGELLQAWERTLHGWTNPGLHDAVLGLAAKHHHYAWLAQRYRDAAKREPADAIPAQRLARLQRAVIATMAVETYKHASTNERSPFRGISTIVLGALVATVLALWLVHLKARDYHRQQRAQVSHVRDASR